MGDGVAATQGAAARAHVLSVTATPHGVRTALLQIRALLRAGDLPGEDCGTAETVLGEVLNNIVEHAYADRPGAPIGVTLAPGTTGLAVEVTDTGAPMPGGRLPEPRRAALDVGRAELPEGGFGWSVIRDLTVDLEYGREGRVNRLRFRIPGAP